MKIIARIISMVLQPVLIPTYGMIMYMSMPPYSLLDTFDPYKISVVLATFIFTGFLPILIIGSMMKFGLVSDLFISHKEQRLLPYTLSLFAYLFWSFFLWYKAQLPMYMITLALGSAITIVIIMFINKWWKISAHLTTFGGLVGAVFGICYQYGINPVGLQIFMLIIAGLVMWSRITLKAHTPMQTTAGLLLGIVNGFVSCIIV